MARSTMKYLLVLLTLGACTTDYQQDQDRAVVAQEVHQEHLIKILIETKDEVGGVYCPIQDGPTECYISTPTDGLEKFICTDSACFPCGNDCTSK